MSQTEQKQKRKRSTKYYDAVIQKVKKLLNATGQTFIPELCEALRKDWYPELSQERIKNDKEVRDDIREKILVDWCYEHRILSENPWSETYIKVCFPDWLRNPTQQDSSAESRALIREAKIEQKTSIPDRDKQKLEDFATKLPNTVIIPEQKPEEKLTPLEEEDEQELYGIGLGKFGDTDKSPRELLGDVTDSTANLFEALMVGKKKIPHAVDADMIVDYIKPTREEWKSLMLEADKTQRARVHNWLSFLADVIEDRLEILSQVK